MGVFSKQDHQNIKKHLLHTSCLTIMIDKQRQKQEIKTVSQAIRKRHDS